MNKLKLLFKSFDFIIALKLALFYSLRRLLNPRASVIYAQTGEDMIIRTMLGTEPGFYVDVGCHDPFEGSNTLLLYLEGWRGLNIDANPRLIARFRARTRDIAVCAAISDVEREMVFYEFEAEAVSTLSTDILEEWKSKWPLRGERKVVTRTLESLLAEHCPATPIDLLTIDVEGHDLNVLRSINLAVRRPKLIVVELHNLDVAKAEEHDIAVYLAGFGYKLAGYATMNAYFVPFSTAA